MYQVFLDRWIGAQRQGQLSVRLCDAGGALDKTMPHGVQRLKGPRHRALGLGTSSWS